MPDQMLLSWDVDCSGTPLGPAAAAVRLAAVALYDNDTTDPVLGQLLGLTVASDSTTEIGSGVVRRVLALNMTGVNNPPAPPPFPCRPRTSTPPTLPYPLRRTEPLAGTFTPQLGSTAVQTSSSQAISLSVGSVFQFISQQGVSYEVTAVGSTQIGITPPFTGITGPTKAYQELAAPATIVGMYSSSDLDTATVSAVVPPVPNGVGARGIILTYDDSAGNGPFELNFTLTGKCPVLIELDPGSIDMAVIIGIKVDAKGVFGNSIGQITLVELSAPPPEIPQGTPAGTPDNAFEGRTYIRLTDEAQLLITRPLAYLPPSYFALAQQENSEHATILPPSNNQLSTTLGQFVATETAIPPPVVNPSTVPTPTFLSGLFTRQLQMALAGIKVTARQITFT